MSAIQAIILGIIQGLTEFIPVSSSGHLLVASELFSIPTSFEAETLLNIGTLAAAIIYFRSDLKATTKSLFTGGQAKTLKLLLIATVPLLVAGVLFDIFLQDVLRGQAITIFMLIAVGLLMLVVKPGSRDKESLNTKDASIVGLAQVLALIPGTSRSGITMLSGMSQKLSAAAAARFSFLLSIPAVGAAIVYTATDLVIGGGELAVPLSALIIGNIAAFIASLAAIHGMITFLEKRGLALFGWYRIGLGAILLAISFI